jgi:hypothetical protein
MPSRSLRNPLPTVAGDDPVAVALRESARKTALWDRGSTATAQEGRLRWRRPPIETAHIPARELENKFDGGVLSREFDLVTKLPA